MFKTPHIITTIVIGLSLTPMLASAQEMDNGAGRQKIADLIYNVAPFVVLAVLFLFFVKRQKKSPAVLRQRAYLERSELHMERVEQLMERIAVALEKDKP